MTFDELAKHVLRSKIGGFAAAYNAELLVRAPHIEGGLWEAQLRTPNMRVHLAVTAKTRKAAIAGVAAIVGGDPAVFGLEQGE